MKLFALLFIILNLLSSPALAAKRVAFVVGISQYEKIESLPNARRDAAAISDRLRDLGFETTEALDADAFALTRAVDSFLRAARGADLALFYFAGHGIQLFDKNYLLARDVDPNAAKSAGDLGLDLAALIERVSSAGPIRQAFLIDACRDNPLTFDQTVALVQRLDARTAVQDAQAARSIRRSGLANIALPASDNRQGRAETLIFFAAQPGNVAYDGVGQNSYFVEGLKEGLAQGNRPLMETFRKVSAYVRTITKGNQIPQVVSDWTEDPSLGQQTTAVVRYNISPRSGNLSAADEKLLIRTVTGYSRFNGDFIVKASVGETADSSLTDAEKKRAEALGSINGFSVAYDLDRDGRDETVHVYFRQVNYVVVLEKDGVRSEIANCLGDTEIKEIEIALRDVNGDRRPELWIATDDGNYWSRFCILEFTGVPRFEERRRGNTGQQYVGYGAFRTLLRHGPSAWDIQVANNNSIKACAGSNCHSPTTYGFDGQRFSLQLSGGIEPPAAERAPFRDERERAARQLVALDRGLPLTPAGPWTLEVLRDEKRAVVRANIGTGVEIAFSCHVAQSTDSQADTLRIIALPNPARNNQQDVEVNETLAYGEVSDLVPLRIRNSGGSEIRCPIQSIGSSEARGIEIYLDAAAGRACTAALSRNGVISVPVAYRSQSLLKINVTGAGPALEAARRACDAGVLPSAKPEAAAATTPIPSAQPSNRLERLIVERYLDLRDTSTSSIAALYAPNVNYYGKVLPRQQIVADKQRYYIRWPLRRYELIPGSFQLTPAAGGTSRSTATFEYMFEVVSPTERRAGRGSTTLTIESHGDGFVIHGERGEVLQRN